MPVSAISHYRGGTVENVTPLAKKMKAVLLKPDLNSALEKVE
jgi:hypothetical protein